MNSFRITEFVELDDTPLGEVVAELRRAAGAARCPADALDTLRELRSSE